MCLSTSYCIITSSNYQSVFTQAPQKYYGHTDRLTGYVTDPALRAKIILVVQNPCKAVAQLCRQARHGSDRVSSYWVFHLTFTEQAAADKKTIVNALEQELANSKDTMRQVTQQHQDILNWADIYADSETDIKKMIVAELISAVRVSKGYKIEIDFKINDKQLDLEKDHEPTAEKKPKQKKCKNAPGL